MLNPSRCLRLLKTMRQHFHTKALPNVLRLSHVRTMHGGTTCKKAKLYTCGVAQDMSSAAKQTDGAGDDGVAVDRSKHLAMTSGVHSIQGFRHYQEDRYTIVTLNVMKAAGPRSFYGVFDGHMGSLTAEYCEEHLHKLVADKINSLATVDDDAIKAAISSAFQEFDEDHLQLCESDRLRCGSCAVTACVLGAKLFTANLGDSRAVLCRDNKAVSAHVYVCFCVLVRLWYE